MAINRTKVIFANGFTFGAIGVGALNYLTFANPRSYRAADGSFSMHDPAFSGFPFDMYMDGYVVDGFLASGLVGNVAVGLAISVALGWIATKIAQRNVPLK